MHHRIYSATKKHENTGATNKAALSAPSSHSLPVLHSKAQVFNTHQAPLQATNPVSTMGKKQQNKQQQQEQKPMPEKKGQAQQQQQQKQAAPAPAKEAPVQQEKKGGKKSGKK
ncbi:hypothetical protein Poli38472_002642 [Pythium oligandrum]|uniref:Uncharacterized protein n=1 Tax=Pythium oligandrum TaxID=41045 RepID=A0A8K1CJ57_PYTOL|nr:hypothetical protein Poli38472_002642 [Pythium oligandrum]|eukprot:TMW63701.1 hypothetical protein Poli38472_002642 [Pythium oligandrum]